MWHDLWYAGIHGYKCAHILDQESVEGGGHTDHAAVSMEIQMESRGLWAHVGFGMSTHVGVTVV